MVEVPEKIKPYLKYGLELDWQRSEPEGVCPFCGGDKFHIKSSTGQYHCKNGGEVGNIVTFIRQLHAQSNLNGIEELAKNRGVSTTALKRWGVVKSPLKDEWLIPGYNSDLKIVNLYRWVTLREMKNGRLLRRKAVISGQGLGHGLFGLGNWVKSLKEVYICEGAWDGPALYDLSGSTHANIIAVPGTSVFKPSWLPLFAARNVSIFFDNDHPKKNRNGSFNQPTWTALERLVRTLAGTAASIKILRWGPDGYDPDLPSGYDIRDIMSQTDLSSPADFRKNGKALKPVV